MGLEGPGGSWRLSTGRQGAEGGPGATGQDEWGARAPCFWSANRSKEKVVLGKEERTVSEAE